MRVRSYELTESAGRDDAWRSRFRIPSILLPAWAGQAPQRLVYVANTSGRWQLHTWDRETGRTRRVTDHPSGVRATGITPDGGMVAWFADDHGNEKGTWLCQPFEGGSVGPLLPGLPTAWRTGLALGAGDTCAVGFTTGERYEVRLGRIGADATTLYAHDQPAAPAGISSDGSLVAVAHCERGGLNAQALRIFRVSDGARVADLTDGPQRGLFGAIFSPVPGDSRVAFLHERADLTRPGVWDPRTGQRHDLDLDLPGDVEIVDWWADGSALVIVHSYRGRDEIYRANLPDGALVRIPHPPGTVTGVAVRPDHQVWYRWSSGGTPPRIEGAEVPVDSDGGVPPIVGRQYRSWEFPSASGAVVHGFLVEPAGTPPYPTLFFVHGGPHHHDADSWDPKVQAIVDHGWAVALVNYRGSTGRGRAWLDLTTGDPGLPEVEDLLAGRADLIRSGVADPRRIAIAGSSWGGYLTLLTVGYRPDGWCAAVSFAPLADLVTAYDGQAASIRSLLRMLFGGTPAQRPDLYRERSPISYAHRVRTPLLIIAGEKDTRCPIEQVRSYTDRLAESGVEHQLVVHPAGHTHLAVDERIRQTEELLSFINRYVDPG